MFFFFVNKDKTKRTTSPHCDGGLVCRKGRCEPLPRGCPGCQCDNGFCQKGLKCFLVCVVDKETAFVPSSTSVSTRNATSSQQTQSFASDTAPPIEQKSSSPSSSPLSVDVIIIIVVVAVVLASAVLATVLCFRRRHERIRKQLLSERNKSVHVQNPAALQNKSNYVDAPRIDNDAAQYRNDSASYQFDANDSAQYQNAPDLTTMNFGNAYSDGLKM